MPKVEPRLGGNLKGTLVLFFSSFLSLFSECDALQPKICDNGEGKKIGYILTFVNKSFFYDKIKVILLI